MPAQSHTPVKATPKAILAVIETMQFGFEHEYLKKINSFKTAQGICKERRRSRKGTEYQKTKVTTGYGLEEVPQEVCAMLTHVNKPGYSDSLKQAPSSSRVLFLFSSFRKDHKEANQV